MRTSDPTARFAFGRNWQRFVEKHFSEERVEISRRQDVREWSRTRGLEMKAMKTGEANTEHMFGRRVETPQVADYVRGGGQVSSSRNGNPR